VVWNIKSQSQRFINLTPTTNWNGTGLLGVTIRMDDYITAEENLLRILDVQPKSPAAIARLTPSTDFLLGTTMESFESDEVLGDVLYENEDQVLEVYVYNAETDVVRVVTLVPSLKWGGKGLLGAQVGRGYLHRLPKACRKSLGISFERKVTVNDGDDVLKVVEHHTVENVNDVSASASASASLHESANESASGGESTNTVLVGEKVEAGTVSEESNNTTVGQLQELSPALEVEPAPAMMPATATMPMKFPTPPTLENSGQIGMGIESLSLGYDLPPPPITMFDDAPDDDNDDLR